MANLSKKYTSAQLRQWMIAKAKIAAGNALRRKIIASIPAQRDDTVIGRLYFFRYEPLFPDRMPKFDKFPLVFPIEHYPSGPNGASFLGLNLHYLTIPERQVILGRLLQFRNNKKMDSSTRLKLSYQLLNGTKGISNEMRPCVKKYLYKQVRSKFIEIESGEWDKAIELQAEDWYFNL